MTKEKLIGHYTLIQQIMPLITRFHFWWTKETGWWKLNDKKELKQHIKVLVNLLNPISEVELPQEKVAIPWLDLCLLLIGTPLGLQPNRFSSSIGLVLSVSLLFYLLYHYDGHHCPGTREPFLLLCLTWIPNIAGIIAGFLLVRKASRWFFVGRGKFMVVTLPPLHLTYIITWTYRLGCRPKERVGSFLLISSQCFKERKCQFIMFGIALIAVLAVTGEWLPAYIGDKLGTKVGKKKLTIFGLRPNASIVVTIITGILASIHWYFNP